MCVLCCTKKVVNDSGGNGSRFGDEKALGVRGSAPGVLAALGLLTFEVLTCFCHKSGGKKFVCTWASCALPVFLPHCSATRESLQGELCPPPQHSNTLLLPTFFCAPLPHCVLSSRACMDNQSAIMAQRLDQSGQPLLDFKVSALSLESCCPSGLCSHPIRLSLQPIFDPVQRVSQTLMHPSCFDMI